MRIELQEKETKLVNEAESQNIVGGRTQPVAQRLEFAAGWKLVRP